MRIDIVVSEYGKLPETAKKTKSFKNKSKQGKTLQKFKCAFFLICNTFNTLF